LLKQVNRNKRAGGRGALRKVESQEELITVYNAWTLTQGSVGTRSIPLCACPLGPPLARAMVNVGLRGYLWERKSVQHKVCARFRAAERHLRLLHSCTSSAYALPGCCALH